MTAGLARQLSGMNVATIHADGWLNLPGERFDARRPAESFYENAIRFDELFDDLVVPLARARTHRVTVAHAEETATRFVPRTCEFQDVDVGLVEGIYLFKRALSREETIRAHETIYFPAQRIHFERDRPRERADLVHVNDRSK